MIVKTCSEITEMIRDHGVRGCNVECADSEYAIPDLVFITGQFNTVFRQHLRGFYGVTEWKSFWDCDDFAMLYHSMASLSHRAAQMRADKPVQGVAIGQIWYRRDKGVGHAVNFAMTKQRGMVFIEPQGPYMLSLSPNEIKSIYKVRL